MAGLSVSELVRLDPQATRRHITGATLLVVDDDPSFRRALRRVLELERLSVVEAADGEQAIRVIEQDEAELLDAVVTDLRMPGISGLEFIEILRECRPGLPVVAMSGLLRLPPDLPPVPLLHKPFDPEELIGTVAPMVLRSPEAIRRQARQMRADAAESRSLAKWQHTIARDQMARSSDLIEALKRIRQRMTRGAEAVSARSDWLLQ